MVLMNANSDPYLTSHRTRTNMAGVKKPELPAPPTPIQLPRRRSAHLPID